MGSSKGSQTIGYWYNLAIHIGWGRGPFDALLEFRGGDKPAWQGVLTASGTITIDALNLWGGEKAEGGIQGTFEVMMGEAAQAVSAGLTATFGADQTAYRGRASGFYKGKYGAFNPYPKPISVKVRRILKGWEDDVCWYPAKAPIFCVEGYSPGGGAFPLLFDLNANNPDHAHPVFDGRGVHFDADPETIYKVTVEGTADGRAYDAWSYYPVDGYWYTNFVVTPDGGADVRYFDEPTLPGFGYPTKALARAVLTPVYLSGAAGYTFWFHDNQLDNLDGMSFRVEAVGVSGTSDLLAMNPAHMLLENITGPFGQGEPMDMMELADWTAAADTLFDEGFGLCTTFNPVNESAEQYQQRLLNIIAGNISQSRVTGKYHLTLQRSDYVLAELPILTDADILEWEGEPSDPMGAVNQVTVEWFDPQKKEKRATTPLQSLGAIQATGGIIADTYQYPEIPYESLAMRVAARILAQKSAAVQRFRMTTTRVAFDWRAGQYFRLQAPRRGIADMVCMLVEIDAGTPRSGSMQMIAVQDVGGMPSTTYVTAEPGVDTTTSGTPSQLTVKTLMEAPYVELAGRMSTADLAALEADVGFLLAVAKRPTNGLNFALWTRTAAEAFVDRGFGDWCPSALVVEAGTPSPGQVAFTLAGATDLDQVIVGTAALWDGEICRVDAINATALTVTLARGCADTVPATHAAGARVWFYDDNAAGDGREYSDGELVDAKLATRTATAELPIDALTAISVTMDARQFRPYPPGQVKINGTAAPAAAFGSVVVTWVHRDRLLQDDQLVDSTAAGIGPEVGTTYTVRYYANNVLVQTNAGLAVLTDTYIPPSNATIRVELESVRDALTSWQTHRLEVAYTTVEPGAIALESGDIYLTEAGDRITTE